VRCRLRGKQPARSTTLKVDLRNKKWHSLLTKTTLIGRNKRKIGDRAELHKLKMNYKRVNQRKIEEEEKEKAKMRLLSQIKAIAPDWRPGAKVKKKA